jgi:hypothetical protein
MFDVCSNVRTLFGKRTGVMDLYKNSHFKSSHNRTEVRADVIRPQNDREHSSPEIEVQEPDRKQPRRTPESPSQGMLFDFYSDLLAPRAFVCHASLPRSRQYFTPAEIPKR